MVKDINCACCYIIAWKNMTFQNCSSMEELVPHFKGFYCMPSSSASGYYFPILCKCTSPIPNLLKPSKVFSFPRVNCRCSAWEWSHKMAACSLLGNIQSNTYSQLYTAVRRDEKFSEKVEVEMSCQLGGPLPWPWWGWDNSQVWAGCLLVGL